MPIVKITPAGENIKCIAGETGSFQFSVLNTSGTSLLCGFQVRADDGVDWINVKETVEHELDEGISTIINVEASPPENLLNTTDEPKNYVFKLRAYDAKSPEVTVNSAAVSVTVKPAKVQKSKPFPWVWVAVAASVFLVAIGIGAFLLSGRDDVPTKEYTLVNSLSFANRNLTFSNIQLNGSNSQEIGVQPGDTVNVTMDWAINVDQKADIFCPGCIVQFYMGVQDHGEKCYVSSVMPPRFTRKGSLTYQFVAPAEEGVYIVNNIHTLQFSCVDVNVKEDTNQALAAILVKTK